MTIFEALRHYLWQVYRIWQLELQLLLLRSIKPFYRWRLYRNNRRIEKLKATAAAQEAYIQELRQILLDQGIEPDA